MKRLLIVASVVLLLPASSLAQPDLSQSGMPDGHDIRLPGGLIEVQARRRVPSQTFLWHGRRFNRVRAPAFRYPAGFSARRWRRGAILPPLFMSPAFFYDDWRMVGFGPPRPGRRWVRYGRDLLLVNTTTRRVEDVARNVFF